MKMPCKRPVLMVLGLLWILFAVVFAAILLEYLAEGAGLQLFGFRMFPGTILIGVVHVLGFMIASGICACVGIWFCACAVAEPGEQKTKVRHVD